MITDERKTDLQRFVESNMPAVSINEYRLLCECGAIQMPVHPTGDQGWKTWREWRCVYQQVRNAEKKNPNKGVKLGNEVYSARGLRMVMEDLIKIGPKSKSEWEYVQRWRHYLCQLALSGHIADDKKARAEMRAMENQIAEQAPLVKIGEKCRTAGRDNNEILLDHRRQNGELIEAEEWTLLQSEHDELQTAGNNHSDACRIVAKRHKRSAEYLRKKLKNRKPRK